REESVSCGPSIEPPTKSRQYRSGDRPGCVRGWGTPSPRCSSRVKFKGRGSSRLDRRADGGVSADFPPVSVMPRTGNWLRRSALIVGLLAFVPVGRAELRPGTVLGSDNWEEAKGLLPDEFLEAYRRGDFRHEIRAWDP